MTMTTSTNTQHYKKVISDRRGNTLIPGGGGDLVLTMPRCVCPKVKDMGPFWASRE